MKQNQNQSKNRRPNQRADYLPDGKTDKRYLSKNQEWPTLEDRLGQPRILQHSFTKEVLDWIKQKENPNDFFYLDAGCGHGNDLRALKKTLGNQGHFLGVDLSRAEIIRGLKFYEQRDGEQFNEGLKLFGLGNLHDLSQIFTWDEKKEKFSCPKSLKNDEVDLIYMEAVLQASGYGYKTYKGKKKSAQSILNEMFRVCKPGGKLLGRTIAFTATISKEQQFNVLRSSADWKFIPGRAELIMMLVDAGFNDIRCMTRPHEKAATDSSRENVVKISFLVTKT